MAEGKREPFGRRIYNAIRALRGDPWPQVFEFAAPPQVQVLRPDVVTFGNAVTLPKDVVHPDNVDLAFVKRDLVMSIGLNLLEEGAVVITEKHDHRGWTFEGRVKVVMPEKKEEPNES